MKQATAPLYIRFGEYFWGVKCEISLERAVKIFHR